MAISIQLLRQSTVEIPDISSYKLVVSTTNAQNMSNKIFVNQRIRNFAKNRFDDVFVAVCTPTQLEDFEEDAPGEGTSYYRTDTIELIARTAEELQAVFDSLVYETKKLVVDLTDLENLLKTQLYDISAVNPVTEISPAPVITEVTRNAISASLTVFFNATIGETAPEPINYQYSLDGGTSWNDKLPRNISSPITITNIENSVTYNLKIRAAFGGGKYGVPSDTVYVAPVIPSTAPIITAIAAGNTQLSIAFNSPENGNVTNYEYSINNGNVWTARNPVSTTSPLVITGLNNGTSYTVKIRGINELGYGISSAAVTGTPLAPPTTFWQPCSAGAGMAQIDHLPLLEQNWKQDATGSALSWSIGKNANAINLGIGNGTGTLRLRCCYKNTNQGSNNAGVEYPSLGVTQINADFSGTGYFRMTFNGKQLFNLTNTNSTANPFSYYPANAINSGGFGLAGALSLNQTGLIDLLIEASNVTAASLRFNLFYD